PRARCVAAERRPEGWRLEVEDRGSGERRRIEARTLVNAAGPWVAEMLRHVTGAHPKSRIRLVKGSHIVVPRLYEHDRAYIFQNADGRIVFAIPFQQDFTLIGTTEVDVEDDPANPAITPEETAYLCAAVN